MPSPEADDAVPGLDDAVDELYVLAPEEFVGRRDDLAKQARSAGDRRLAAAVRRLKRPTTSAWALNLLSREEPDLVGQLLELGEALRQAQSGLDGAAVRELDKQRRAVVGAMARRAGALAADHGHRLDAELSRQVEQSLAAALSDPEAGAAVTSGQLTRPVSVVGFGVEVDPDAVAVPALVLVGARRRREKAAGRRSGRTTGPTRDDTADDASDEDAAPGSDDTQDGAAGAPGPERHTGRTSARQSSDRSTRSLADARTRREQQRKQQAEETRRAELRAASAAAREALATARTEEAEAERAAQEAAAQVDELRTRLDELRAEREDLAARLARCDEETAGRTERLAEQEQQQDAADQALLDARRATRQAQRQAEQTDRATKT